MDRQQSAAVTAALDKLSNRIGEFGQLTFDMWYAYEGYQYPLDMYATGAIKRTLSLLVGFRSHIESFNFTCAAPLVRLQLDTALRFYAAFIVTDPQDFALKVLEGTEVRKLKDRNNQLMRDAHLVKCLGADHPWIESLYKKASGYVHLSNRHAFDAARNVDRKTFSITWDIRWEDKPMPDHVYLGAIDAFDTSAVLFAEYIKKWTTTKADPVAAATRKSISRMMKPDHATPPITP
jgi:hypothetical protein